jgi:hypothetical protein
MNYGNNLRPWECPRCNHNWQLYITDAGELLTETNSAVLQQMKRRSGCCRCGQILGDNSSSINSTQLIISDKKRNS